MKVRLIQGNADDADLGSDPDVSVEALMERLRESARERDAALPEEVSGEAALRDALRGKADFDQSVAESLLSTVRHLQHLGDRVAGCERRLQAMTERMAKTDEELDALRLRLSRLERRPPATAPVASTPPNAEGPAGPPFDYFLFEQRFRGPVAEIKRRQAGYLDLFRSRRAVLDLGCGRGEFLELLAEHDIPVTGVDRSEDMVDFCRGLGLAVVQADLFAHLESLPDESLDGVFVAQVVEHLTPDGIARLVGLCARKLQPGGVMVAETVNPGCPVALGNFYRDPTHVRPVPAELLQFLFEQALFEVRCLRFSAPTGGGERPEVLELEGGFVPEAQHYQDYAVVAVRRPEEEACGS